MICDNDLVRHKMKDRINEDLNGVIKFFYTLLRFLVCFFSSSSSSCVLLSLVPPQNAKE